MNRLEITLKKIEWLEIGLELKNRKKNCYTKFSINEYLSVCIEFLLCKCIKQ